MTDQTTGRADERLAGLVRLARVMADTRSLPELAERVCEEARFALGARNVSLSRLEPERGLVRTHRQRRRAGRRATSATRSTRRTWSPTSRCSAPMVDEAQPWRVHVDDPGTDFAERRAAGPDGRRLGDRRAAAGGGPGLGRAVRHPVGGRHPVRRRRPRLRAGVRRDGVGRARPDRAPAAGRAAGVPRPAHRAGQPPAGRGRARPGAGGDPRRGWAGDRGDGRRQPAQAGQRRARPRRRRPRAGVGRERAVGGLRPGAGRGGRTDRRRRVLRGAARLRPRGRRGAERGVPARCAQRAVRRERRLRGGLDRAVRRAAHPRAAVRARRRGAVRGQADAGRRRRSSRTRRPWPPSAARCGRATTSRRRWPRRCPRWRRSPSHPAGRPQPRLEAGVAAVAQASGALGLGARPAAARARPTW